MTLTGEKRFISKEIYSTPFCPTEIPQNLAWGRTRISSVTNQRQAT